MEEVRTPESNTQPRRRGVNAGAILGLAVMGFSAGFGTSAAFAGTAASADGYFTTSYAQWQTTAYVKTSTKNAYAWSAINRYPVTGNVPTGYMGARGRLFIGGSTTNMSCEGTTQYNDQPLANEIGFSCTRTKSGTWNSYGVVYGWGSGSYTASYTFNSPNQNS